MAKSTTEAKVEVASTPLLCPEAIERFDEILSETSVVYEQGSGGSTRWIAERVKSLVSIEHSLEWFEAVSETTKASKNLESRFIPLDFGTETPALAYVDSISTFPDEFFDVVWIDGWDDARFPCAKLAVDKVKLGGYVVVDDSNWAKLRRSLFSLFRDAGWTSEEIRGQKIHPKTKQMVWTRTAFFRKPE